MAIARHAKVVRPANIRAELDRMVALNLGPFIDELVLVFVLDQRTIAAVHSERVPELEQAVAVPVNEERRHAGVEIFVDVHTGDARVLGGGRADSVRLAKNLIAEPAEAKIREQGRPEIVVESAGDGVITGHRRSRIGAGGARGVEARAAGDQPEGSRSNHAKVLQRVTAE